MTPEDFKAWRKTMGWNQKEAAEALGLSKRTVASYEAVTRHHDGGSVDIPTNVALACLEHLRTVNDRELAKAIQELGTPRLTRS